MDALPDPRGRLEAYARQNLPDKRAWLAAVEAGRLPVGRGLLLTDGLAALAERKLKVTALGRRFVRHVAACLDARFGAAPARHSSAV